MPFRLLLLWLTAGLLFLSACSSPDGPPAEPDYLTRIPDPKTLGETYVSNPDSLLAPATVQDLNATLQALDQSGRAHIDVVAVRSIGEETPKTAATALFNRWKIGGKDQNNGLLLLLVLDQRRVEMETGYGLEADLPDVTCFRIQQQYMVPLLRQQRYDEAVREGVAALIRQFSTGSVALAPTDSAAAPAAALQTAPEAAPEPVAVHEYAENNGWSGPAIVAAWLMTVLWLVTTLALAFHKPAVPAPRWVLWLSLVLLPLYAALAILTNWTLPALGLLVLCYGLPLLYTYLYLGRVNREFRTTYAAKSRHEKYTFLHEAHHNLGFTAWLLPLGLAFYWPRYRRRLRQLREAPYACPRCATPMHRLSEQADDEKLELYQAAEEHVKSVDYDVWACPQCQHSFALDYQNLSTDVLPCPKCHHRTLQSKPDQVMQAATTASEGWGWHVHRCYFCNHEQKEKYTISRIPTSSSSSSGGSSSSSSSGSSWSSSSGGSSGGGGAGSSW
ncbi:TPM domain-containing protein [Hymenobacter pini]|uniref:TPM domain-containing protein n=1 Tax=Hymenobacter pini TaxID=2880879 RepID=UPI001CF3AE33|nr:TPM domain-containing protein [Hymenobacter pini]MCA8833395.1 TPM domain-containing protein [Hymenobacter pini]